MNTNYHGWTRIRTGRLRPSDFRIDEVLRIATDGGKRKWIQAIGKASFENQAVSVLTGVLLDVTRVTEAERELHRAERRYRELSDNMP